MIASKKFYERGAIFLPWSLQKKLFSKAGQVGEGSGFPKCLHIHLINDAIIIIAV